jgi:hypothetical protein
VRLADDNGAKPAVGVIEFGEERDRLGTSLQWDRPRLVKVEEL